MPKKMLEIDRLTKSYPSRQGPVKAIDEVTFSVDDGAFVSVVGPSGCGKTTLMMGIAGLRSLSGGNVILAGSEVTGPPADMAVVFQDYSRSLFPWLTVSKNVSLPLKGRGLSKSEIAGTVERALHAVGMEGAASLHPWQLSGGMQQRAAIARGLAQSPKILLMDEPFASVDAQTRATLEDLVLDVWREYGMTILFVTHDIDEAVYLSDQVVVLTQGPSTVREIIEVDLPRPRDQIATKELPEFAHLRAEVFSLVMGSARRGSLVATDAAETAS
jgi:NitT/TauT family transport system ATP-binding protein